MRALRLLAVLCLAVLVPACSAPTDNNVSAPSSGKGVGSDQPGPLEVSLDEELAAILAIPDNVEFKLNTNATERDKILRLPPNAEMGGCTSFEDLDVATLEKLLRLRFANPRDRQNEAPSIAEIFRFMKRWPMVRAFGYAVTPDRDDYRVSIEGICAPADAVSEQLRSEFAKFCKGADEMTTKQALYAWWD